MPTRTQWVQQQFFVLGWSLFAGDRWVLLEVWLRAACETARALVAVVTCVLSWATVAVREATEALVAKADSTSLAR